MSCLPFPMSQDHLAHEFALRITSKWRYVHDYKQWFFFDGTSWRLDVDNEVKRMAVAHCRAAIYWKEAANLSNAMRQSICSYRYAGDILAMTKYDRIIATTSDKLGLPPKKKR